MVTFICGRFKDRYGIPARGAETKMRKILFTAKFSLTISRDSADGRRKNPYRYLIIKMIVLRILPLIIIFKRVSAVICRWVTMKYSLGKVFILRTHTSIA